MIVVVTGGAASGKSAFAEELCSSYNAKNNCYIATMEYNADDGEAAARVKRHQAARAERGFSTLEIPYSLADADFSGYEVALLECMGNLLANEIFSHGLSFAEAENAIKNGIVALAKVVPKIVIVSNEIYSDGEGYSLETMQYIFAFGKLAVWLAETADEVYEVVCGIPLKIKGDDV